MANKKNKVKFGLNKVHWAKKFPHCPSALRGKKWAYPQSGGQWSRRDRRGRDSPP